MIKQTVRSQLGLPSDLPDVCGLQLIQPGEQKVGQRTASATTLHLLLSVLLQNTDPRLQLSLHIPGFKVSSCPNFKTAHA
jgi:hypothetical protein